MSVHNPHFDHVSPLLHAADCRFSSQKSGEVLTQVIGA
jgi:hypothetical protein